MQFGPISHDNPFAFLTFLAAPAVLTNASSLLVLSTSNRLARAADRARQAATELLNLKDTSDPLAQLQLRDFNNAARRARMLVSALRAFYGAAGAFAGATCVALAGALAASFGIEWATSLSRMLTVVGGMVGVAFILTGSVRLLAETRIALRMIEEHHAAITQWRATHQPGMVKD